MRRGAAQGRGEVRVHHAGARPATRFRENLRKAIAAGLPADAALAALTRDAAEILGVAPQVGPDRRRAGRRTSSSATATSTQPRRSTSSRSPTACGSTWSEQAAPPPGAGASRPPPRKGPRTRARSPTPQPTPAAETRRPSRPAGRGAADRSTAAVSRQRLPRRSAVPRCARSAGHRDSRPTASRG